MKLPTALKLTTLSPLSISRGHLSISHFTAPLKNSKSPTSIFNLSYRAAPATCSLTIPQPVKSPLHNIFHQVQTALHKDLSCTFQQSSPPPARTPTSPHSGIYEINWMRNLSRSDPSPKHSLADKWREYHGASNWEGLLDPLDENLRREIVKYGEFAQATYDAFNSDPNSSSYANCVCNDRNSLFDTVGLHNSGYKVTKYLYATPSVQIPQWLSQIVPTPLKTFNQSNWMGFVAVSDDLQEIKRFGRRDIVIAWRGTSTPSEWAENLKTDLKTFNFMPSEADGTSPLSCHPKVENGFLRIYTNSSNDNNRNTSGKSASEQVMEEVQRLVELYKDENEELSITITGHSLGASLALLSAYEITEKLLASNNLGANHSIPVTVFSFGGPKVGNLDFKERMEEIGVKTLRIVNTHDVIPKLPGILLNECVHKKLYDALKTRGLKEEVYSHVGKELRIDHLNSPYLKRNADMSCCHNLEAHLHLVDGFHSSVIPFRSSAKRDYSLVNKTSNLLKDELMVPANWLPLSTNSSPIFNGNLCIN